ncbi:NC domain-containing protein [Trichocoleus sp. FACHB-591]|uniref:NC domain-containing protein n=1 Tax=Trichocoleus sp. FACHB-591 TaxID=2692872 RepID=UPI001687044D|nr:NC domain-containing protein [Trichocoleus sp. FACHB-591]MBD2095509.1 NC domain-containing protein [Trichocoleus sp. FACHB-591]
MTTVTTTFVLTDEIKKGLADGTYERVGGMIRETQTKRTVQWLREIVPSSMPGILSDIGSVASVLNLGVSIINLGVSVMGFQMVSDRLDHVEKQLQQTKEVLLKSNEQLAVKIDLSFYANLRAAISLADFAFTMADPDNRKVFAAQAINRFLEAKEHYLAYADSAIESSSRAADKHLLTLFLACIAEARCHLEPGEPTTASLCLQKGNIVLRSRLEKYINILLTTNPAAYLHPSLNEEIDLSRLTHVYKWLNPELNENSIFQEQRSNFFKIAQSNDQWVRSLPDAVIEYTQFKNNGALIYSKLPKVMEKMEAMIETYRRFEAYQGEVQAIAQLGISFQEWLQLKPAEAQPEGAKLMYIMPSEPLKLISVN